MLRAKWQTDSDYDFDRLWEERKVERADMARRTVEEHAERWLILMSGKVRNGGGYGR